MNSTLLLTTNPLVERFFRKVKITNDDECWFWIGGMDKYGYGRFWATNRNHYAHRWIYRAIINTTLPDNLVVRHKCDTPSCCNPSHLLEGTIGDNNRDCRDRGRTKVVYGSAHVLSKLNDQQIKEILLLSNTHSQTKIALMFKVSRRAIGFILAGTNWKHLTSSNEVASLYAQKGEKHHNAKLTVENVREIRHLKNTYSLNQLAAIYHVNYSAIYKIVNHKNWKHV